MLNIGSTVVSEHRFTSQVMPSSTHVIHANSKGLSLETVGRGGSQLPARGRAFPRAYESPEQPIHVVGNDPRFGEGASRRSICCTEHGRDYGEKPVGSSGHGAPCSDRSPYHDNIGPVMMNNLAPSCTILAQIIECGLRPRQCEKCRGAEDDILWRNVFSGSLPSKIKRLGSARC